MYELEEIFLYMEITQKDIKFTIMGITQKTLHYIQQHECTGTDIACERNVQDMDLGSERNVQGTDITSESERVYRH